MLAGSKYIRSAYDPANAGVVHHRTDLFDTRRTREIVHAIHATNLISRGVRSPVSLGRRGRTSIGFRRDLWLARDFAAAGGQRTRPDRKQLSLKLNTTWVKLPPSVKALMPPNAPPDILWAHRESEAE